MERIDEILEFWFGHVEDTIVPSENRARIWFGEDLNIDNDIKDKFSDDMTKAIRGEYQTWEAKPRGRLALIIILDQFSRHIYRYAKEAYAQDDQALRVCLQGIEQEAEHALSLIERVFYYFPLLHAENIMHQERSIRAYALLKQMAFSETQVLYDSFLKFANHHYSIIQRFGRFPQRNSALGRESTTEELAYLKEMKKLS